MYLFSISELELRTLIAEVLQEQLKPLFDLQTAAKPLLDDEINFSIREAAIYLKCSTQTIHTKKRNGELPYYRTGRLVYFKKSEIDRVSQVCKPTRKVKELTKYSFSNN